MSFTIRSFIGPVLIDYVEIEEGKKNKKKQTSH